MRFRGLAITIMICVTGLQTVDGTTEALTWNMAHHRDVKCIYGEITPLASVPGIYFCGSQWGGVGGYCGIQHNRMAERRTIFSMWDTSPTQRPRVTEAHPRTVHNRFGGEGEGGHTHMLWEWKYGDTFRFFLRKRPGTAPDTTDTSYYIFDAPSGVWLHEATINSPNGKNGQGTTFPWMVSWIENFGHSDLAIPKAALYSLWIGPSPDKMERLTRADGESGSGRWGQLHGNYLLAEGSRQQLDPFFVGLKLKYGEPTFGVDGKPLPALADKPLPPKLVSELGQLPRSPATTQPKAGKPAPRK
jgi:hypothetical protein